MTNTKLFISQSEPSSPKVIMVDKKMRTDVSILSGGTGSSVTPKKRIPIKQRNMKSPGILTPRKDPIPDQDSNTLITQKYQSLPPH